MMTNTNKSAAETTTTAEAACDAVRNIAAAVAALLGWHGVPSANPDCGCDRTHTIAQVAIPSRTCSEARLVPQLHLSAVTSGKDKGKKIEIGVSWPRDAAGQQHAPDLLGGDWRIAVSASKSAQEIARDVNRRLMTRYLAEYARQSTLAQEWDDTATRGAEVAQRLAAAMEDGRTWARDGGSRHEARGEGDIEATVYGDRVSVGLGDLTEAQAIEVIQLVRGMKHAVRSA